MTETLSGPSARGMLRDPVVLVWMALILATLLSFWLGTDHGLSSAEARALIILVVAFTKVRFVGAYFMELRDAPTVLRAIFEGWCVVVCLVLMGMYLWV